MLLYNISTLQHRDAGLIPSVTFKDASITIFTLMAHKSHRMLTFISETVSQRCPPFFFFFFFFVCYCLKTIFEIPVLFCCPSIINVVTFKLKRSWHTKRGKYFLFALRIVRRWYQLKLNDKRDDSKCDVNWALNLYTWPRRERRERTRVEMM